MDVNKKKLNPLGFHLMKWMNDPSIRLIILYGGSSSGKSYSVAQLVLLYTLYDGENSLVMRKVGASINKSIYEDFKVAARQLGIFDMFKFKDGVRQIISFSGAKIDFGGLDDPEKLKGISNYKRVVLDEWSEFEHEDYKQVRLRLRGKHGQQIITTFNPINETHWIKKKVFDVEKWNELPMEVVLNGRTLDPALTKVKSIRMNSEKSLMNPRTGEIETHAPDTLVIQTTYLNNFWVVGSPDGTYGYYDEQCIATFEHDRLHDPDYYNVYALGEWGIIRSGSEFFASFNRGMHCHKCAYDASLPVHVSVDNNVLPYISVTYWQVSTDDGITLRQIGETIGETPDNTVRKSARLVAKRLADMGCRDKIFLHGDASTRAANTIDEEKRSFLDLFIDTLQKEGVEVEDCVGRKNPSVPMSGEFINAVFDGIVAGYRIEIDENCSTSIDDYLCVQKDVNGAILKTKVKNKVTMQSYEEHGHLSDTFRYVVCDVMKDEFALFSNRRKRNLYARDGAVSFFNPDTQCAYDNEVVFAMPYVNGLFVMVHGKRCGDKWHIVDAAFRETSSTEEIKSVLVGTGSERTIIECPQSYYAFIRELRKELSGVRVMQECGDLDRRIAATSDYVRNTVLFNASKIEEDDEYAQFMTNLLDYNKSSECYEASAVLSGFAQFVAKSFSVPLAV
jgi:phage terminase large subunit